MSVCRSNDGIQMLVIFKHQFIDIEGWVLGWGCLLWYGEVATRKEGCKLLEISIKINTGGFMLTKPPNSLSPEIKANTLNKARPTEQQRTQTGCGRAG